MNYGFVKVASAIPSLKVADCSFNTQQIISCIHQAEDKGAEIIVFPELCISGYTCQDLFGQRQLISKCEESLSQILDSTRAHSIISIVGMPVSAGSLLMNCAVAIQNGRILGCIAKTYLSNSERRWFVPSSAVKESSVQLCSQTAPLGSNLLFHTPSTTFAIEIGEDLWAPIPPSSQLALQGAEIIFNLSASNEEAGKHQYLTRPGGDCRERSCLCISDKCDVLRKRILRGDLQIDIYRKINVIPRNRLFFNVTVDNITVSVLNDNSDSVLTSQIFLKRHLASAKPYHVVHIISKFLI